MTSIKVKPAWPPPALRQIPNPKFLFLPRNFCFCLLPAARCQLSFQVVRCKNFSRFPLYLGRYGDRPYNFEIRNSQFEILVSACCPLPPASYPL
jgi:hypothetical protein